MGLIAHRCARLWINGCYAHLLHQTPHSFRVNCVALSAQIGSHLPTTIKWVRGVLLIDQRHQRQVERCFRRQLVIVGGAIQPP